MTSTADTTIIAHALATGRGLARQAATARDKRSMKVVFDLLALEVDTFGDALLALKRVEEAPTVKVGGQAVGIISGGSMRFGLREEQVRDAVMAVLQAFMVRQMIRRLDVSERFPPGELRSTDLTIQGLDLGQFAQALIIEMESPGAISRDVISPEDLLGSKLPREF